MAQDRNFGNAIDAAAALISCEQWIEAWHNGKRSDGAIDGMTFAGSGAFRRVYFNSGKRDFVYKVCVYDTDDHTNGIEVDVSDRLNSQGVPGIAPARIIEIKGRQIAVMPFYPHSGDLVDTDADCDRTYREMRRRWMDVGLWDIKPANMRFDEDRHLWMTDLNVESGAGLKSAPVSFVTPSPESFSDPTDPDCGDIDCMICHP